MTLSDARAIRDLLRSRGIHSVVPLGNGPDGYFARIFLVTGRTLDFADMKAARDYLAGSIRRRRKAHRDYLAAMRPRRRSPIDIMIDNACGYTP